MNPRKPGFKLPPFIISMLITIGIGAVAGFVTEPQIKGWYVHLQKPSFNPPNQLFAPVWTLLYIMIGFAAYLIWINRRKRIDYVKARLIYIVQLLLNFSWSIVFFGLHQILGAVIIIVLLLIVIVLNIIAFNKINKTAAWLLVPYLLWVAFASALNLYIYLLNR